MIRNRRELKRKQQVNRERVGQYIEGFLNEKRKQDGLIPKLQRAKSASVKISGYRYRQQFEAYNQVDTPMWLKIRSREMLGLDESLGSSLLRNTKKKTEIDNIQNEDSINFIENLNFNNFVKELDQSPEEDIVIEKENSVIDNCEIFEPIKEDDKVEQLIPEKHSITTDIAIFRKFCQPKIPISSPSVPSSEIQQEDLASKILKQNPVNLLAAWPSSLPTIT